MHANIWPDTSLIDLVITLHTDNTTLYDRYTTRNYSQRKIDENIDCEIMNVIGAESREYYEGVDEDGERTGEEEVTTTVVELVSDTEEDLEGNVERLMRWVEKWQGKRKEYVKDNKGEWERVNIDDI